MGKGIKALVVIIIIIAIVGGAAAYFFMGDFSSEKKKKTTGGTGDNILPEAYFSGNTSGFVGEEFEYDGNGSKDEDGEIDFYDWEFGDGNKEAGSNASIVNHTYSSPGTFMVNLTVSDDDGGKDSYTREVRVRQIDQRLESRLVLSARKIDGIEADNFSKGIQVDEFAKSLSITITFNGVAWNGAIESTVLTMTIYNPMGIVIGNETQETRAEAKTMDFFYYESDLILLGEYTMEALCEKGTLSFNYLIEVKYE